jgi:hypothetical protein
MAGELVADRSKTTRRIGNSFETFFEVINPHRVLAPRVSIASDIRASRGLQLFDLDGENVTTTKHGFESRWGHHSEMREFSAQSLGAVGGGTRIPVFSPVVVVERTNHLLQV